MKYQVVLFDLDGTVTDSGPGIMNSVQYALGRFGITNPDRAVLRRFVGPPLDDSFKRFFGFSPEEAAKAVQYYREYYSAGGIFENSVYDGMDETLRQLKAAGCRVYLATSKPQVFSEQILEHFGLTSCFDGIVGSFLDGTRVNKAEVVGEALRQAGITPENRDSAVMVGDREYDVIGAHSHGIAAIGVLFGYGSREELEKAGADGIAATPEELLRILRQEKTESVKTESINTESVKKALSCHVQEIMASRPYKLVISKPVSKSQENKKINVLLKKGYYQVERYTKTQVFHENLAFSKAVSRCIDFMPEQFLQMNAWSENFEFSILISRKGKISWKKKEIQDNSMKPQAQLEHNRKKQYILEEGEIIPPLVDMGIFTKDGRIAASMQDKFRQINRFVEIVDDAVKNLNRDSLRIVDFGCGKSYLTFILYYYFTQIRHIKVDMTGLDLKETVIDNCNRAAEKYGYTGLHFEMGDINGYKSEKPADMVITLHACDTATDYALFHAICWKAGMIFSVPCCQHELNKQFSSSHLPLLGRYGIVRERTAALMTDAIRANLLEYCGYKTQLMEFVDLENTPKNLLIRAVRHDTSGKEQYLEEVENLMKEFRFSPTLYRLLEAEGMLHGRNSRMRSRKEILKPELQNSAKE